MGINSVLSTGSSSSSSSSSSDFEVSSTDLEEIKHIDQLSDDVLIKIFSELSDIDRHNVRWVCVGWSKLIKPISHPNETVFGARAWKKYFGYGIEEHEVPKPPLKIIKKMDKMRSQLNGEGEMVKFNVENEMVPCSLMLIPKGLTFNKLTNLIKKPKDFLGTEIKYSGPRRVFIDDTIIDHDYDWFVEEFGEKPIDKTCWVLFYAAVIKGSRDLKTYESKNGFIEQKTDSRCRMPKLLEVLTWNAFIRAKTGEGSFTEISTLCKERLSARPFEGEYYMHCDIHLSSGPKVWVTKQCLFPGFAACQEF